MIGNKRVWALAVALVLSGCSSSEIKDFVNDSKDFVNNENSIVNVQEDVNMTDEKQMIVDMHNNARADVGVTHQLVWSDLIANDAQSYADTLAQSGAFEHDPKNHGGYVNGLYGENLYASTAPLDKNQLAVAVKAWIDEKAYYHYGKVGDANTCDAGEQCGHYTQVIWENSSKVGCATSIYQKGDFKDGYVFVCKYQTPGNYIGETPY